MQRILLCFMLFGFGALYAQESMITSKGLLWEISGNGASRPGYVYGTMHIPEKLAFNLSDSFFVALRSVDVVALESDHGLWQVFSDTLQNQSFGTIFRTQNSQEQNSYSDNFYEDCFSLQMPSNQVLGAMLSAKPLMTNEFLTRSSQERQDFEEDTYLDQFIYQSGKKLGKEVIGLETLEGNLEASIRSSAPDPDEDEVKRERVYIGSREFSDAYRKQDLALLDSLDRLANPSKNFRKWMLDERNIVHANGFDSLMRIGKTVFAGVGASHLPGEMGVLNLLREKGYTVRAVTFTDNGAKKEITKLEQIIVPVAMTGQWYGDSTWYVETPGKMYQTRSMRDGEEYLNTDMSNGAYYAMYRINTYGLWAGYSPEEIALKIDSLIYEKVPGKIQEQTQITSPFVGHNITTRTKRGDAKRYKIFITPNEAFYFTVSGNGDYALGEAATRYLNSIQFGPKLVNKKLQPEVLAPKSGGFTVTFPVETEINTTEQKDAILFYAGATDVVEQTQYFILRETYYDESFIEEDTFELNIIAEKIAAPFTKKTPDCQLISTAPYPTQDFSFRSDRDSAYYFGRIVIDGPRYYLIGCRKQSDIQPIAFFNSFSIMPTAQPEGTTEIMDTSLRFSVTTTVYAKPKSNPLAEHLQQVVEEVQQQVAQNEPYYENRNSRSKAERLVSRLTGEKVNVNYRDYISSPFSTLTYDSLKKNFEEYLIKQSLVMVASNWIMSPDNKWLSCDAILKDTNSTRTIRTKTFFSSDYSLTITSTNRLGDTSEINFTNQVFNTFKPTKTPEEVLIFGERDIRFLDLIYDVDSLKRADALSTLSSTRLSVFKPEDLPNIQQLIRDTSFQYLKPQYKNDLFDIVASLKTTAAVDYLTLLFETTYKDSIKIKNSILKSLVSFESDLNYQTFFKLWTQTPIYIDDDDDIFGNLNDSLQLTQKYLSKFRQIGEHSNYTDNIIRLYYNLLADGLLKPTQYKWLKNMLLYDAERYVSKIHYEQEDTKSKAKDEQDNYSRNSSYSYRSDDINIEIKFKLLAPFINDDKAVKKVFEDLIISNDSELKILAICLMLEHDMPVNQDTLQRLSTDSRTAWDLYVIAANKPYFSKVKMWYQDTLALATSCLMSQYEDTDSIKFISQHRAMHYGQPSTIYFFDIKEAKAENWKLAFVNLPDKLFSSIPNKRYQMLQSPQVNIPKITDAERETFINTKIGEIRFKNRDRYRANSDKYDIDYDYSE